MSDSQDRYFCPRLVDYIVLVGSPSPLAKHTSESSHTQPEIADVGNSSSPHSGEHFPAADDLNRPNFSRSGSILSTENSNTNTVSHIQNPDLLRRYPAEDHNDFPLPKDIVCFCQPEGCITTTGRLSDYNKMSSFVFTISDKDTVRTRYGVCVNFYRPVKQILKRTQSRNNQGSIDYSSSEEDKEEDLSSDNPEKLTENGRKFSSPRYPSFHGSLRRPKQKVQYNTLTSICLISHHPFFSSFRDCLFYLKNIIDTCNEFIIKLPECNRKNRYLWDVIIHKTLIDCISVKHYIKEIEKWILRLLSAPVPVPGKTRVEITLYPPANHRPPLIFALPDHTRFPLLDFPLHLPLELLGIEMCLQVLVLILLERKVVFQSRDYNALSMSVMGFIALIYPLEYMFPVIPLLPISLDHSECLLDNPTPYVVGVPVNFFSLKGHFKLPNDIWLIDLDTNKITPPYDTPQPPQFPQPDGAILKNHLRSALNKLSVPIMSSNLQQTSNNQTGGSSVVTWTLEHHHPPTSFSKESQDYYIQRESQTDDTSTHAYNSDVDSVDVEVRVAMVRFFNSANVLANLTEHTRTIRLFPRPVVSVQNKSFIQSRREVTPFIEEFSRTQSVDYLAEMSLMPSNVVFQRIHTDVVDPKIIGDKSKWFAHTLEPITFSIWNKSKSLENIFKYDKRLESAADLDQSGIDTDVEDNSLSPTSSTSNDNGFSSPEDGEMLHFEDVENVYKAPNDLQIPRSLELMESPILSSTSASTESDLNSPEFQPSSLNQQKVLSRIGSQRSSSASRDEGSSKPRKRSSSKSKNLFRSLLSMDQESDDDDVDMGENIAHDDYRDGGEKLFNSAAALKRDSKDGLLAQMDKITIHAKKAAGEASKSMQEVSKTALEASKTAAGVSRSTFEDLTYVGRNTLGDLTKSAKNVASKTRFLKVGLLSDLRSPSIERSKNLISPLEKSRLPGSKILVEKSPLIRHSSPKKSPETLRHFPIDKALNSAENQAFLNDIAHQVLEGDNIGWLKLNRCKKLLEDESNRCLLLKKLNRTLDIRINPSDYIDDVYLHKNTWKAMLKVLQAAIHGLEASYNMSSSNGMASIFHVLEIAHTHYWCREGDPFAIGIEESQFSSPFGSHEELPSPVSVSDVSTGGSLFPGSRKTSDTNTLSESSTNTSGGSGSGISLKSSQKSSTGMTKTITTDQVGNFMKSDLSDIPGMSQAADMFRDLFNKKKESGRSPSMDTGPAAGGGGVSTHMSPESNNPSESGSMVTNPSYVLQRMHKNNLSFRSTVSDSEIEHTTLTRNIKNRIPSAWSSKSSLSAGFRFGGGGFSNYSFNNSEGGRMYLFEGLVDRDRSSLWDKMQFWEDAFIDAVSHEREIVGIDQGPEELMDKYKHLNEDEQRRLAHDEDRLLSTMLYNLTAFMIMMNVRKEAILSKVRSMLGKCRIAICYAEEINTLLSQINSLDKNEVDLRCVASRLGHGQSFAVHVGIDSSGTLLFVEVRDDGLVMRTMNGTIYERWWYERVINMTYSPKNKVLCLWKKVGGQTSLHKYYTKKSKQLYYCIKSAMERAVEQGQQLGETVELGGEFPVKDLVTGEGGLLQVCMEGVGLLFCGSKFFIKLKRIRKCFTVKGKYFIIEEYNPKMRSITERKYESSLAPQICYSVLCVFSYAAAAHHHKIPGGTGVGKHGTLTPDSRQQSVDYPTLP